MKSVPSIYFCKTGRLETNEKYNQNLHSYSNTIRGRAQNFYTEKEIQKMEEEKMEEDVKSQNK